MQRGKLSAEQHRDGPFVFVCFLYSQFRLPVAGHRFSPFVRIVSAYQVRLSFGVRSPVA